VRFLAENFDQKTAAALDAQDNAYRRLGTLEPGSLLDVRLDVGGRFASPSRRAGTRQRFAVSARASRTVMPARSLLFSISSRDAEPANTADPIAPGEKRLPSSFIHATTSMGRTVPIPASSSASRTSNPASTPYAPVVFPAGGLTVEVRAGENRVGGRVGALSADEEVADLVTRACVAARRRPSQQLRLSKRILDRKCQAVDATARRRADLPHVNVAVPEARLGHGGGNPVERILRFHSG